MAGGGKGANLRRDRRCAGLLARCLSAGAGWPTPCRDGGRGGDSQAYLGPRALCRTRDMMIDWAVLPPAGDAAAQSIQAVRLALHGRTGSG